MGKKLVTAIAVMLIAACLCAYALAAMYIEVTVQSTNVRTGPGLGFSVLGTANYGDIFDYQDQMTDDRGVAWYRTSYYGSEGWISAKNAAILTTGDSYDDEEEGSGDAVAFAEGDVNVRTGPGLNYDSLGTLYRNQTAYCYGDVATDERGVQWHHIQFNGNDGWVSSKYVRIEIA